MRTHRKTRTQKPQVLYVASIVIGTIVFSSCLVRQQRFDEKNLLLESNLGEQGWIPSVHQVPESARDIRVRWDMDTNRAWMTFRYGDEPEPIGSIFEVQISDVDEQVLKELEFVAQSDGTHTRIYQTSDGEFWLFDENKRRATYYFH